ncbi:MAG: hypothetical protein FRX49_11533 [Trebouxia sp. A1-2]|nr:MAG: hypothetical protein FRX49_11533 [Trebouxia sp. A1-2]
MLHVSCGQPVAPSPHCCCVLTFAQARDQGRPQHQSPANYPTPTSHTRTNLSSGVSAPPSTESSPPRHTPRFWSYRAPGNYNAPTNYHSPRTYQAPRQYGVGGPTGTGGSKVSAEANGPGNVGGHGGGGGSGGTGGAGGFGPGGNSDESADGVGGIMGYKKKRSKDSLIASSIITGLLLSSAYLMGKPNTTYGVRLALVTTASLAAYMGKGYYDKRKVFPQGVLACISTVMTLGYIGSL